MLTLHLPSGGPSTSWEGPGDTEGTGRADGNGSWRVSTVTRPDAQTAWVARGGGALFTALGVGEHCRLRFILKDMGSGSEVG